MMRQYIPMRILALTPLIMAACRADSQTTACTDELRVQFAPADTAILPGAAFTASVQLATCGGAHLLTDAFIWHSEDSTIATVDSLSGLVVGVAWHHTDRRDRAPPRSGWISEGIGGCWSSLS